MAKRGWIPPRSPFGLLQEDLGHSEWLILIACQMLNCTARRQVEGVLPKFIAKWPGPEAFVVADPDEVVETCRTLGFANRRTKNMLAMTRAYLTNEWKHASELPGIGVYGSRCWEMLCLGIIGEQEPSDGALRMYWKWAVKR